MLEKTIHDCLEEMTASGRYAQSTLRTYRKVFRELAGFVNQGHIPFSSVFDSSTLQAFHQQRPSRHAGYVIRRFSRYLFQKGLLPQPIHPPLLCKMRGRGGWRGKKSTLPLPEIYEQYLRFYVQIRQVGPAQIYRTRGTLSALENFLQAKGLTLSELKIEHVDSFLRDRNKNLAPETHQSQRSALKGFLRYLYQDQRLIKRDLGAWITHPPMFAQSRPPKYLQPEEIEKLFQSIDLDSPSGLRAYAMLSLAFSLGLRLKEISLITLDDLFFQNKEIRIKDRKNAQPTNLPLPDGAIKAIAAYIAGGRPNKATTRALFCQLQSPYGPMRPLSVSIEMKACFHKAGIRGSGSWLRHTYAQNLLQAGASIFEIKDMLGHETIKTSQKYLHVHTTLMREVLFDEDV